MRAQVILITLLAFTLSAHASDGIRCIEQSIVATFDPGDSVRFVTTSNDHAYVYQSNEGVHILDITDPTKPSPIGIIPQSHSVRAINADHHKLFIANIICGIEIYDTANPENPNLIGIIPLSGVVSDIAYEAPFLYYLHSGTLRIADITAPAKPAEIGSYHMGSVTHGLRVADGIAYVAAGYNGLYLIDITAPSNPNLHRRLDIPGSAEDIAVNGTHAYVISDNGFAQNNGHVRTYDVSNPKAIVLLNELRIPGRSKRLVQHEDILYIANGDGVLAIDITTKQSPELLGLLSSLDGGNFASIAYQNNHLFVAKERGGLEVLNPSAYANPLFSETTTPPTPQRTLLTGTTLYIANAEQGLAIYDTLDPNNPMLLSSTDTSGTAHDVAVENSTALVADGVAGLHLLDITDPTAPLHIATYPAQGSARAVRTYFGLAYLATDLGLEIVNFTDPNNPFRVSFLDLPKAHHLALGPGVVYVACDDLGLHIINTLNPANPQPIGYYNENNYNARNITVDANRIFVSNYHNDNNGWLEVFDVTNPANPVLTDIVGYGCDGAYFDDGLLYAIQRNELTILDPYTQTGATPIVSYPLKDRAGFLLIQDNTAYITAPDASTLSIINTAGCACKADFDADGLLNVNDVTAFLAAFMSQSPEADLNNDASFNFFDISAYIESFLTGCP